MRWLNLLLLTSIVASAPEALALHFVADDLISIDSPVEDDLFAGGNSVNVNSPVDSAVIVGGIVRVDAPIEEDLIVFGDEVDINSDVGGKIVALGGTINLRGRVERNVVMAGGQVRILSSSEIGRDAALSGGDVYNAGNVTGTLWVSAGNFVNAGTAGDVSFQKVEADGGAERSGALISTFSILVILGFFLVGLVLLRLFPGSVSAVDREVRRSPLMTALLGLGLIVATMVLATVSALTVAGLPLALLLLALFVAALLLANLFVSFALGKWISSAANQTLGDLPAFVIGYLVLSLLFLIPYAGSLIELASISLGFGAIFSAVNECRRRS